MKISREIIINGMSNTTEYELTGIELEHCFNEYQNTHDRSEIVHQLIDAEYEDIDGIPEDIMEDLVRQFRERMNDRIDEVALEIIRKNEERLEPYKETLKVFEYEITRTTTTTIRVAAKSEEKADEWMEEHFGNDEGACDEVLECEDSDYDYGCGYETGSDPRYADYNAEEDE